MEQKPPKPIPEEVFEAIYNNLDLQEVAERWEDLPVVMRRIILEIVQFAG